MQYDVVMVTYNSEKWLPGCVQALARADYDLKRLHLIFVDNGSSDGTLVWLNRQREQSVFGGFTVASNTKNTGFGAACNQGAGLGGAPLLFFLNLDTAVDPRVFRALDAAAEEYPAAGGFECRQLPYELGHHVDPVTLETSWASGAAFCVRRPVFERAGGFDPHLFMYCEDVDLSWRIRAAGAPLYYLPQALVYHYVLDRPSGSAAELREYAGTCIGKLLLTYKYGSAAQIWRANKTYLQTLRAPRHFDGVRRVLLRQYLSHFAKLWSFLGWRFRQKTLFRAAAKPEISAALRLQQEFEAERGRFVLPHPVEDGPKISVVVRTCSRPASLRKTLCSLRHQTYRNFEVLVMEDGPAAAREMVETEFSDLPIRYYASGERLGRGKNGNLGLALANGQYLNFLDDDDYFYPDHLELMAAKAMEHPEADLILGCAMVMKVEMKDAARWEYQIRELHPMHFDRVDLFTMCQTCQIPIQSAVFKKSLFEACGGLNEELEGNEDWFMWMRYLACGRRIDSSHVDIDRATSVFVLPAGDREAQARIEKYRVYDQKFYGDDRLRFTVTLAQMRGFYDGMIADMRCLEANGQLHDYLEKQAGRGGER